MSHQFSAHQTALLKSRLPGATDEQLDKLYAAATPSFDWGSFIDKVLPILLQILGYLTTPPTPADEAKPFAGTILQPQQYPKTVEPAISPAAKKKA